MSNKLSVNQKLIQIYSRVYDFSSDNYRLLSTPDGEILLLHERPEFVKMIDIITSYHILHETKFNTKSEKYTILLPMVTSLFKESSLSENDYICITMVYDAIFLVLRKLLQQITDTITNESKDDKSQLTPITIKAYGNQIQKQLHILVFLSNYNTKLVPRRLAKYIVNVFDLDKEKEKMLYQSCNDVIWEYQKTYQICDVALVNSSTPNLSGTNNSLTRIASNMSGQKLQRLPTMPPMVRGNKTTNDLFSLENENESSNMLEKSNSSMWSINNILKKSALKQDSMPKGSSSSISNLLASKILLKDIKFVQILVGIIYNLSNKKGLFTGVMTKVKGMWSSDEEVNDLIKAFNSKTFTLN
jgi:hypothetical protein